MLSDLLAVDIFASLSQTGSVQKTAAELGIESSTVSRRVAKLERQIGRQLFDRSKRPIELTRDGRAILQPALRLIAEQRNIENYFRSLQDNESMTIRVMIGNGHINFAAHFACEYAARFPHLRLNIVSPTEVQDFVDGKADIICLSGQASLSGCHLLPRGRMVFIPVASPQYVRDHGMPLHPDELSRHRSFSSLHPTGYSFRGSYQLTKRGRSLPVRALDSIRFSNVEMTHRAAIEGLGIALCLPIFLCIDDLEAGRLVPVLDGWHRPSHLNYVACKDDDWKIRQIRLFASWWAAKLTAYEKQCEKRLAKLFGQPFLQNLLS